MVQEANEGIEELIRRRAEPILARGEQEFLERAHRVCVAAANSEATCEANAREEVQPVRELFAAEGAEQLRILSGRINSHHEETAPNWLPSIPRASRSVR